MRAQKLLTIGAIVAGLAALAAVVAIGLSKTPESQSGGTGSDSHPLDAQTVRQKLGGAPRPLAALHEQANELLPGGRAELQRRLAAVKGHPAVVNIWAAWCGPCIIEMPIMQQVSLDYGKRVAFLGVDTKDARGSATRLLRRIPVTYPSIEDGDGRIFEDYGLVGMPSTIFYDASGKQTFVHQGLYDDRQTLENDVQRYAVGA